MYPIKRPFHSTVFAGEMVSRFPAWMKIRQSDSVGFRFLDAVIGNELELFSNTLDLYSLYTSITRSPIDAMEQIYQLDLSYVLTAKTITADDNTNITVVEDRVSFLNNLPTRYKLNQTINPSGLEGYNIVGMEWLDSFPSGQLVIKRDIDDILPSSLLYYPITTKKNIIASFPTSGTSLGLGYVGLGHNSSYESVNQPESRWSLEKKYPSGVWMTPSGTEQTSMPSGVVWSNQSYVDPNTGLKVYYQKALNNPYGSGVYNQADLELTFTPISGTIKVYDVFNLSPDSSGHWLPTDIPSSGLNYFTFTSGIYDSGSDTTTQHTWNYKGFQNPVPWEIMPEDLKKQRINMGLSGIGPDATLAGTVSWRILPSGGYIDDEVYPNSGTFVWVDGTGDASNIIRFSGHFSKYDIQYAYRQFTTITQITADKESYKSASPSGDVYFITSNDFSSSIFYETSASDVNAIRMDPYQVRPGVFLNYILTTSKVYNDTWLNAQTTDKTVQFYRHNIGYTDNLGYRNV